MGDSTGAPKEQSPEALVLPSTIGDAQAPTEDSPAVPAHHCDSDEDTEPDDNEMTEHRMSRRKSKLLEEKEVEPTTAPELPPAVPKESPRESESRPRRLSQRGSVIPEGQRNTEENRITVMNKVTDLYDAFVLKDPHGDLIVDFHEILAVESGHTRESFRIERKSIQETVVDAAEADSSDDEMAFGHKEISLADLQAHFVKRLKKEPLLSILNTIEVMVKRCKIQGADPEDDLGSAPPIPPTIPTDDDIDMGSDKDGDGNVDTADNFDHLDDSRQSISATMDHAPPPIPTNMPPSTPTATTPVEGDRERSLSKNSFRGSLTSSSKKMSFSEVKGENPHKGSDMRVTNLDLNKVFVVEGKAVGEEKTFSITLFIDLLILKGFYFNPQDTTSYAMVESYLPKAPEQPDYDDLYDLVMNLQTFHKKQEMRDALWVKLKQEEKDKTCLCMAQWKQDEIEKYMLTDAYARFKKAYERAVKGRRDSESGRLSETPHNPIVMNSAEMNR